MLRRSLLANRQAIPAEVRRLWDAAIGKQLIAWWRQRPVATLGVYMPIRAEPDLLPAYTELAALGVRLALPIVTETGAPLQFVAWKPGDPMGVDPKGIPVPAARHETIRPEALLIPCVGFNQNGFRLGYGGGFYDRTLATVPRPLAIGIAYACSRAVFEAAPHDVPMDVVITE